MKTGDNSHTLKSILPPKIPSPTSAASGLDHVAMRGCGARWPARARHMGAEQDRSDTGSCSKRGRREGRHCEKHIIDPKNCGSGRCRVPRLRACKLYAREKRPFSQLREPRAAARAMRAPWVGILNGILNGS